MTRRTLLGGGGALVVSFSLRPFARAAAQEVQSEAEALPEWGSLKDNPMLDSWIRIDAEGKVTVFTGKAELGQGIKTALVQLAADELSVPLGSVALVTADTARTADEGYTAASHSMEESGTAIWHAASQVRHILTGWAAERLGTGAGELRAEGGAVLAPDGRRIGYGELVAGRSLHVAAAAPSRLKPVGEYKIIGTSVARIDIPAKVTGGVAYVQDLRLPGMVHARIVRPPSRGARLTGLDTRGAEAIPGFLKVVRNGNFLAVVAEREFQAIRAMQALAAGATWQRAAALPNEDEIFEVLRRLQSEERVIKAEGGGVTNAAQTIEARYLRPYQMHGSIGPSCAVALYENDALTVWSHTQGAFPLRAAVSELLRMPPEKVRVIHMEGAGCYGHNAADDVGGDAALVAREMPGRPVRVQWMREQEHGWEPLGSAMITEASGQLDADGNLVGWTYDVWSCPHSTRPGGAGWLLPGWEIESPFQPDRPKPIPQPAGGGDRNAIPLYRIPNVRVVDHFIPEIPIRTSALRSLGAYMNVFSVESFMDELARAAKADPVAFRMRYLEDPRARAVVETAAEKFGWKPGEKPGPGRGQGFAFARYKNLACYVAIAVEAEVDAGTGYIHLPRIVAAIDSGLAVNPDGIRNQTEGGILQASSWTRFEEVRFSTEEITSRDWGSYPIMRFESVPGSVEVHIVNRPDQPFLGTGEGAQGPTAAAIANAVADATGVRIRTLPLSPKRVKAALGV
nr:molybdopterin cofactor-binding domain-containing protein [Propylenella binzhouense]